MKMIRALMPTLIVSLTATIIVGIFLTQSSIQEINLSHYELLKMRHALQDIDSSLSNVNLEDELCIMVGAANDTESAMTRQTKESAKRIDKMLAEREAMWFRVLEQVEKDITSNLIMAEHGER